jgi:rhodanese-related sulfurtransferase
MTSYAKLAASACLLTMACPVQDCPAVEPLAIAAGGLPVGPYCGIDCIYTVARQYGRDVRYADLVDARFVGSHQGSSPAELVAAAQSVGLAATPQFGLSIADLQSLAHPSILLLSRHRDSASFRHWVLVTHAGRDRIWVMESPGYVEEITHAQLLAQWDGIALVVYPDAVAQIAAERQSLGRQWTLAVLLGLAAIAAQLGRRFLPKQITTCDFRPRSLVVRSLGIVIVAGTVALAWHATARSGFWRNDDAVSIVKSRFLSRQLPHIGRAEVAELIGQQRAVIIDARYPDDYARGHLPSAINVPLHITPTALQKLARELPQGKRVVVYFLSEKCPYDEEIGSQLALAGVKDVLLYPGGWKEWQEWDRSGDPADWAQRPEGTDD